MKNIDDIAAIHQGLDVAHGLETQASRTPSSKQHDGGESDDARRGKVAGDGAPGVGRARSVRRSRGGRARGRAGVVRGAVGGHDPVEDVDQAVVGPGSRP